MKLIDAIKETGRPFVIPDSSRNDLPEFCKTMGYETGAEVGVFLGEFTKLFCETGLNIIAIDPWSAYSGAGRTENVQDKQNKNYEDAKKNIGHYDNCHIVRKTSLEAAQDILDSSLDFVYIDGDHRFRHIAEDIVEWEKKVRPGGALCGHDYFNTQPHATNVVCHVKSIVDAFAEIKNWDFYVFGEGTDQTPSWMFIKK